MAMHREKKVRAKKDKQGKPHHCVFGATLDPRYVKCHGCDNIKKTGDNNYNRYGE